MTAAQQVRTARSYRGVVYGIPVYDDELGRIVPDDYVGKTRQRGRLRENQHRDNQPFSDRIVGSPRVLWEGVCTDEELAGMERHFIQDVPVRPRLNVEMNEDNPDAIPKWKQIEQRHERDRAEKRELWVPLEQRQRKSLLEWETPDRPAFQQPSPMARASAWTFEPWEIKLALWLGAWLFSTLITWGCLTGWGIARAAAFWTALIGCGVTLATSLLVPARRRRRKRRSR